MSRKYYLVEYEIYLKHDVNAAIIQLIDPPDSEYDIRCMLRSMIATNYNTKESFCDNPDYIKDEDVYIWYVYNLFCVKDKELQFINCNYVGPIG